MSEYQYYEFQAIDRPLSKDQMAELRHISSRAQITPASFINVYNYGDFKGNPHRLMEQYFDIFLYLANWGTRWFMLRLSQQLLDTQAVDLYTVEDSFSAQSRGDYLILSFQFEEEEPEWAEGEGWLPAISPLRSDLMHGDHRCLYLGWLLAVQKGDLDDAVFEPPVPPGLGSLSPALKHFTAFLRMDEDLITAAAEKSGDESTSTPSSQEIAQWVAALSLEEKEAILVRLIEEQYPYLGIELRRRALQDIRLAAKYDRSNHEAEARTAGELCARAEVIAQERRRKEAELKAREDARRERERTAKRKKYLESLDGKEADLWSKIDELIATKQPKRYDEAVSLLQDLRDLGELKGGSSAFSSRMDALYTAHSRKPSLIERFRRARLAQLTR
jgi:hypothetical protein